MNVFREVILVSRDQRWEQGVWSTSVNGMVKLYRYTSCYRCSLFCLHKIVFLFPQGTAFPHSNHRFLVGVESDHYAPGPQGALCDLTSLPNIPMAHDQSLANQSSSLRKL